MTFLWVSAPNARTAVDLAVPFSPLMRTPPILGFIKLKIKAFFSRSWP